VKQKIIDKNINSSEEKIKKILNFFKKELRKKYIV